MTPLDGWDGIGYHSVEERNGRHGSGGSSPERGGDSRQCDLDHSPVNFLRKYTLLQYG